MIEKNKIERKEYEQKSQGLVNLGIWMKRSTVKVHLGTLANLWRLIKFMNICETHIIWPFETGQNTGNHTAPYVVGKMPVW